jgi:hypothetical protein
MGIFTKVEDQTPREVYNFRVYLYAAVASAGAATIGYDGAFIGGTQALVSFRDEFGLTKLPKADTDTISQMSCRFIKPEHFLVLFWPILRATFSVDD